MRPVEAAFEVADLLARSGVMSPGPEARHLVAHVLGLSPSQLITADEVTEEQQISISKLAQRRGEGVPLQHLTGVAHFRYETLSVGPGVFIPRPETETMVDWAVTRLAERPPGARRVIELCAGSGAITAALLGEVGGLEPHVVEISPEAYAYLEHNLAGQGVELVLGDMAEAFHELNGMTDMVIANPPYIPDGDRLILPSDVVDHDPGLALFGGPDGLREVRVVACVAARLLKPGGLLAVEHGESQAGRVARLFGAKGFLDILTHPDLTGRSRFTTAMAG